MQWKAKAVPDAKTIVHLQECLGVNQVVACLLAQRGITTFDQAKSFFRPDLSQIHDPFLMKDMDKAVGRLQRAIDTAEPIMVFGDYDVDGTTSVSLLTHFLTEQGLEVTAYVPDRYKEGYGLSIQGIDTAHQSGIRCIVALDCGVKALEQVSYANGLGIDLIICDHHTPGDLLPNALAVLDPKRSDCAYPYKELCGCGVGFKLIQAITQRQGKPLEGLLAYLDLVAVAIAADIVPITGENRALSFFGLQQLNTAPRPGLKALMREKQVHILFRMLFLVLPHVLMRLAG